MPQQTKTSQPTVEPDEADVLDYLQRNPTLLAEHPQVLSAIDLPDSSSGDAISLIERQIKTLRDQNHRFEVQITDMVLAGQNNQRVVDALLNIAIEFYTQTDRKARLELLPSLITDQLDLLTVSIRQASSEEPVYQRLEQRFEHSDSICDHRLAGELLRYLFPDHASEVESVALMAIKDGDQKIVAVLALAGAEQDRFRIDSGTVYLDQLAKLISAALA